MHLLRYAFNCFNYVGYCFWGFSTINLLEQLLNKSFNFKNLNSFFSLLATIIALIFAIVKLINYIKDSKIKSKILEEELIEKHNKNRVNSGHIDFYDKFNNEFNK